MATLTKAHPVELDVSEGRRRLRTCAAHTSAGEEILGADTGKLNDLLGRPGVALTQDLVCDEPVVLHTAQWRVAVDKRSGSNASLPSCSSLFHPCDSRYCAAL